MRRLSALLVACALTVTGCGLTSSETELTDARQDQELVAQQREPGTIDLDFETPPTLESKAELHVPDVATVVEVGPQGILTLNADNTVISRIVSGRQVWDSAPGEPVNTVAYVEDMSRQWIVAHDGTQVYVYDAYAARRGGESVRRAPVEGTLVASQSGAYFVHEGTVRQFHPATGFFSTVSIPENASVLASVDGGLLVEIDGRVMLAGEGKGWGIQKDLKDPNAIVGLSQSMVALQTPDAVVFVSTPTGRIIAQWEGVYEPDEDNPRASTISFAVTGTYAFLGPIIINTNTGEVIEADDSVRAIRDGIVYLHSGEGTDLEGEPMWNGEYEVPLIFNDGRAVYLGEDGLHFVNPRQPLENLSAGQQ